MSKFLENFELHSFVEDEDYDHNDFKKCLEGTEE